MCFIEKLSSQLSKILRVCKFLYSVTVPEIDSTKDILLWIIFHIAHNCSASPVLIVLVISSFSRQSISSCLLSSYRFNLIAHGMFSPCRYLHIFLMLLRGVLRWYFPQVWIVFNLDVHCIFCVKLIYYRKTFHLNYVFNVNSVFKMFRFWGKWPI